MNHTFLLQCSSYLRYWRYYSFCCSFILLFFFMAFEDHNCWLNFRSLFSSIFAAISNPLKTNFPSRIWTIKGLLDGVRNTFPSFTKSILTEKSEEGISSEILELLLMLVILFLWPLDFCPCRHGGIFWPIDWPWLEDFNEIMMKRNRNEEI